jgi:hypothetical protein
MLISFREPNQNRIERTSTVYRIRSIRLLPVLLVIAFSLIFIAAIPAKAQIIPEKTGDAIQQNDSESGKKIRKMTDLTLNAREASFRGQARSLAKGYRETAEIVARQGGNPKPILDAAAYFERQAEVTSKVSMDN